VAEASDSRAGQAGAWQHWAAFGSFGLPVVVYLLTLAPGITWSHGGADGGDLITAAYTLGIPHPPGYPTYCLLGWLFARLPLPDVAGRFSLMSAMGAALASFGLYAAVLEWQSTRHGATREAVVTALGAAWGLAFVPLLWSQALVAEVYAVNAAFVACVLWLALRVHSSRQASPVVLGLVWGLSLGVHLTNVALLPVLAWALATARQGRSFLPMALRWLLGTALGLCVFAYLPLRAGRGAVTWGDPSTVGGWWWVVSGALYRGYVFALPPRAIPARLLSLMRHLVFGFGPTGVALIVGGVESLARQRGRWSGRTILPPGWRRSRTGNVRCVRRELLLASGLSWLSFVAYGIGYDTSDSYVYLIPAMIIAAFWLAEGLAEGVRWLRERLGPRRGLAVGMCLAFAGPMFALVLNYQRMDVHRDTEALDFGEAVLAAAPSRAVLLSNQDAHTFTLWYFQHVLGRRSDVAVVDTGLLGYDWYLADLRRAYPELLVPGGDVAELGRANAPCPVCEVIGEGDHWLQCIEGE
jgi:hypothetical protein